MNGIETGDPAELTGLEIKEFDTALPGGLLTLVLPVEELYPTTDWDPVLFDALANQLLDQFFLTSREVLLVKFRVV